jgi:hypothetical protein
MIFLGLILLAYTRPTIRRKGGEQNSLNSPLFGPAAACQRLALRESESPGNGSTRIGPGGLSVKLRRRGSSSKSEVYKLMLGINSGPRDKESTHQRFGPAQSLFCLILSLPSSEREP